MTRNLSFGILANSDFSLVLIIGENFGSVFMCVDNIKFDDHLLGKSFKLDLQYVLIVICLFLY